MVVKVPVVTDMLFYFTGVDKTNAKTHQSLQFREKFVTIQLVARELS